MMNSKELRVKAWDSLKGKYWLAFGVAIVLGFLSSLGTSMGTIYQAVTNSSFTSTSSGIQFKMQTGATTEIGSMISGLGSLISIFVGFAASVGLCNYFIRNTYSKPLFKDAFSGFKAGYKRNIKTLLLVGIKTILWSILFIIPGIIKAFEYAVIPYILADDPEISSKDAFIKAKQMMKGNKWRLFKLNFSFIGWELLCVLTLGIGAFFLVPYIEAANAEFYMDLKNNENQ